MPLEDPVEEAKRIIQLAEQKSIILRLFGGVAFYLRCPSARRATLSRAYADLDFMGHTRQSREIKRLLCDLGYAPRERFNAMHGYRRLIFNDIPHQRRVDIFLDVFEMCHRFNFKDRMETDEQTIPLADLLATKLQIVEINEKDVKDILSLLMDYDVGGKDEAMINGSYLARLCGGDWGTYRTFAMNMDRILSSLDGYELGEMERQLVRSRIERLRSMLEAEPKSFVWRLRAIMGERVRWYELPEPDKRIVDS